MFEGKKVIIFDMDGTLIDSIGIWNRVDETLISAIRADEETGLKQIQAERDEALRRFAADSNPYVSYCGFLKQRYRSRRSVEEIHALRYQIAQDYLEHGIDYKDGADELVRRLKAAGYRLCIATTTGRNCINTFRTKNRNMIAKARLDDYFDPIYTREDAREIKPNPEIYLRIMRELGVGPSECLVFEDSLIGVEAAVRAGIEVAAVYGRYSDGDRDAICAIATYEVEDYRTLIAREKL
ncbi:MAG: HAD family phosphatase [Clostridiales bacterium]|nr:HAD family phosphatase [Clostridiales bacterium]